MSPGALYLLPVPLIAAKTPEDAAHFMATLPTSVILKARALRHFVAESAKSARAFLKWVEMPCPLRELDLQELNEHTPATKLETLLMPLLSGYDLGLLSEAGCPAVADPGAALVALAHARGIRVAPLVGPSSLLLALMASGLDGQRFAFHGYLPAKTEARALAILELEKESALRRQTQIFIETPYRNPALFADLIRVANPASRLCVAINLTSPDEFIKTHSITVWRERPPPALDRHPAVFLLLSGSC
ncbi:MAG: SAM-dependent methyltransferase [Betaproteobacteria bacterium]|nr:SAM-dependent methyltransferase [Betaproteobacteria bacterium]